VQALSASRFRQLLEIPWQTPAWAWQRPGVTTKAPAVLPPALTGIGINGKIVKIVREKAVRSMKIHPRTGTAPDILKSGF